MKQELVAQLIAAERGAIPLDASVVMATALSLDEAWSIQAAILAHKQRAGERLCGYKIANADPAKMAELGLSEPMFGFLTDANMVGDGGDVAADLLIAPRIEMEVAFLIGEDLAGATCQPEDVWRATAALAPGLEIIDGRFRPAPFDAARLIADNISTCRYVVGAPLAWAEVPRSLQARFAIGKTEIAAVSAIDARGTCASAVASLVRKLARDGIGLRAGQVVLSGGLSPAVPVKAGDHVTTEITGLGRVSCHFV